MLGVNVDDYGADPTGTTDSRAAFASAISAVESVGGGRVFCAYGGRYRIASATVIDGASGKTAGIRLDRLVWLEGAGPGHGRSGGGTNYGPTVIYADAAMSYLVHAEDQGSTSPDHRGGGIKNLTLTDNATSNNYVTDAALGFRELNNFKVRDLAIIHFRAANVKGIEVTRAENGSVTEWWEIKDCELWNVQNGIWVEDNNPDGHIAYCTIQAATHATVSQGDYGIYLSGNAITLTNVNVLFYDKMLYLDGAKYGRCEHIDTVGKIHLEGYQAGASGMHSHFVHLTGTGKELNRLFGLDFGNGGKVATYIEIGTNVEKTKIGYARERNSQYVGSGHTKVTDNGTGTVFLT